MKLRCKGVRGAEIFFIEKAIPRSIRNQRISKLSVTAELASALRTLRISTFSDLIGLSLRNLQRVSDNSSALFLELSRLIKLAARQSRFCFNRGAGGDLHRNGRSSHSRRPFAKDIKLTPLPNSPKEDTSAVERTTSARPCGSSDEQTGLPKHLIPVLPLTRPSPISAPDWPVRRKHQNFDASSRQPVHPPDDFVSGSQPADSARAAANNRDDWLADRIFIPISERGRSLRTLTISVRLSNVLGQLAATLARRFARQDVWRNRAVS